MSEFLTTSGLGYSIEKIIKQARKRVIIISPFIQISRNYYERLMDAESRDVRVTIVFGKEELTTQQEDLLSEFEKLDLFFCDNLHAKCYLNENSALISSMNLYEFSQINNREMGLLIDRSSEPSVYDEIIKEAESTIKASSQLVSDSTPRRSEKSKQGTCIRCGTSIPLDPEKPLCRLCFNEWDRYGNPDYEEKYCHVCGKKEKTSIARPLCHQCFRNF